MERKDNTSKHMDPQESIIALIRVLYGLAIVSGAKTAADYYFQNAYWCSTQTWIYFILTGSALFVGLSDWLMYHFVVSKNPYFGIGRLIADMLFPICIFSLFYAVRWPPAFLVILSAYFIACWIYIRVIWKNLSKKDKSHLGLPVVFAFSMSLLGTVLHTTIFRKSDDCCAATIALISCSVWIIINLIYVRQHLGKKKSNPTGSRSRRGSAPARRNSRGFASAKS
jgi:hypothetical protein